MNFKGVFFVLFYFTFIGISSCQDNENPNKVYFEINSEDRKITVPTYFNDSIAANLIFDTGGSFIIDSAFCATHNFPDLNLASNVRESNGSEWSTIKTSGLIYDTPLTIRIGNADLTFDNFRVWDWRSYMHCDNDGLFNIPANDTRIWELNFEHNYLEIHEDEEFKLPDDCITLSMVIDGVYYPFFVQIPMEITFADGDSITLNQYFFIDTGMPWDVALITPTREEYDFFDRRDDAIWTWYQDGYSRYYTVNANLFDSFQIDSLRVYTFDISFKKGSHYLVGLNFLKRFNVFFDMKNQQIGLQPINNFKRLYNPNHKRLYYIPSPDSEGNIIVRKVAHNKDNPYKIAGLKEGDEIVALNGTLCKNISSEEYTELKDNGNIYRYDILRDGKAMTITVVMNKDEVQGD